VVESGENLFISFPRPKIGVFGVFVIYYKAGFEKAVGISFWQAGDIVTAPA
jgi:hypothetical protein